MPWTAAILAGGQGRRLGGTNKSSLVVGADTILERQVSLLRDLTPHILIAAGDRMDIRADGIRVVADRIPRAGALGGLYTALVEAPTEQVLVIACDMPFLNAPFLRYLVNTGLDADVSLPRDTRGRHPLCAVYCRRIADHLRDRILAQQLRVADALAGLTVRELEPTELAPFDRDGRLLCNVNTPDDYARARV